MNRGYGFEEGEFYWGDVKNSEHYKDDPLVYDDMYILKENCKIFSFSHAPSVENDRPTEVKTSLSSNSISLNDTENREENPEEALKELIKWSRHTSG